MADAMHRRWCSVSAITVTFVTALASVVTWLFSSARWRRQADQQAEAWRRAQENLLTEMSNLQDDATRAQMHTAQVTQATAEWSEGYKQGCDDMIKAVAALHGGVVMTRHPAEGDANSK
jgi:hypothetical protein